jgi:hypothetical protein
MLTDFYVAFATVCFTLLGLWIIVVQTRHGEWRQSAVYRRRAYGVALHFSLPGLMSLLSLIDPASTDLWRISFAIVAAGGVLALALVRGPAPTGLGAAAYVAAVALYVLIALVAVVPGMVADIGVLARLSLFLPAGCFFGSAISSRSDVSASRILVSMPSCQSSEGDGPTCGTSASMSRL